MVADKRKRAGGTVYPAKMKFGDGYKLIPLRVARGSKLEPNHTHIRFSHPMPLTSPRPALLLLVQAHARQQRQAEAAQRQHRQGAQAE